MTPGMLREAERQFKSSLLDQDMVVTYLELVKARKKGVDAAGEGRSHRWRRRQLQEFLRRIVFARLFGCAHANPA